MSIGPSPIQTVWSRSNRWRWYVINRVQLLSHKSQKVVTNHKRNIHLDDIPIAIRRAATATASGKATEADRSKL